MNTAAKPTTIIGQVGHFHSAYDGQGHWQLEDSPFMPVDGVVSDTGIEEWNWPSEGSYIQVLLTDADGRPHFNELSDLHFGPASACPQQRPTD